MKRFFVLLFCFSLMIPYAVAQGKIRGTFDVLNGLPKKNSLEKVVFEEFLNYGCPHCNNFRNLTNEMREKYKGRVEFIDVPILFRGQNDAPLRLYYVARFLGRGEEVKHAIFDTRFKHDVNVFDPGIINYLARSLGMGTEYKRDGRKPEITRLIQEAEQKSNFYGIRATPTIVLASTLKMNIGRSMEDFVESLSNTIDDLLVK